LKIPKTSEIKTASKCNLNEEKESHLIDNIKDIESKVDKIDSVAEDKIEKTYQIVKIDDLQHSCFFCSVRSRCRQSDKPTDCPKIISAYNTLMHIEEFRGKLRVKQIMKNSFFDKF
jgi:hypothetical protein